MKKLLSFLKHEWLLVIATILFNLLLRKVVVAFTMG